MEGVATAEAIDTVMKLGMNHPMGPLALADLIGLDTCLAIMEVLHDGHRRRQVPAVSAAAEVRGRWLVGRKAGRVSTSTKPTGFSHRHPYRPAFALSAPIEVSWALIPLTEEQRAIQRAARDFARDELAPQVGERDRDARFDRSLIPKLAELGFLGMLLPEEYDGLGLDTCTYLVALEEIAAVDASAAVLMSVHNSLPTQMILRYGSREQRARFLPAMARGEILGAFALSEPEAGSDAAALTTRAVRDGNDWILDRHQGLGDEWRGSRRHHGARPHRLT